MPSLLESPQPDKVAHSWTEEDGRRVLSALRSPRGHYSAERASQLSGIPVGTLRSWQRSEVLIPDWSNESPCGWSYRDIVYARLLVWLRSKKMPRPAASNRVKYLRELLAKEDIDPAIAAKPSVRSDGKSFLIGKEMTDRVSGQQVFQSVIHLFDVFELVESIDGVSSRGNLWGPSLIRPSRHTYISPDVVAGEPCINESRIPTSSIHALYTERGLSTADINSLYPQLDTTKIEDALDLESRLLKHAA